MHGIERCLFQLPDPDLKLNYMDFITKIVKETHLEYKLTRLKKYHFFLPEVRNFCASLIQDW